MTKSEFGFETWFNCLSVAISCVSGKDFQDKDSVRPCYEAGDDVLDVAKDVIEKLGGSAYA